MSFLFSLLVSALAALGLGPTPGDAHGGIFTGPATPGDAHGGIFVTPPAPLDAHGGIFGVKKP